VVVMANLSYQDPRRWGRVLSETASLSLWTKRPVRSAGGCIAWPGPAREVRAVAADNGLSTTLLSFQVRNRVDIGNTGGANPACSRSYTGLAFAGTRAGKESDRLTNTRHHADDTDAEVIEYPAPQWMLLKLTRGSGDDRR